MLYSCYLSICDLWPYKLVFLNGYQSLENQTYHKTRDESKINEWNNNYYYEHKVSIFYLSDCNFFCLREKHHRNED